MSHHGRGDANRLWKREGGHAKTHGLEGLGANWLSIIERLDGGDVAKQRRGDTKVTSLSGVFLHKRCVCPE
jgi:hypothetical protein